MTRNQLRIARRHAEYESLGTIQYLQAHRTARPRRWMRRALEPAAFLATMRSLIAGLNVSVHQARG